MTSCFCFFNLREFEMDSLSSLILMCLPEAEMQGSNGDPADEQFPVPPETKGQKAQRSELSLRVCGLAAAPTKGSLSKSKHGGTGLD